MPGNSWSLGDRALAFDPVSPAVGADVQELQTRLERVGYHLTCDGVYGRSTAARVGEFQADRRLDVDGVAGRLTISELSRVRRLLTGGRPRYRSDDPAAP